MDATSERAVSSFDHVSIECFDLDASIEFYMELFGLKVVKRVQVRRSSIAWLDLGDDVTLELICRQRRTKGGKHFNHKMNSASCHICFRVPDWDPFLSLLRSMNIALLKGPNWLMDGALIAFISGPSGELIEIKAVAQHFPPVE